MVETARVKRFVGQFLSWLGHAGFLLVFIFGQMNLPGAREAGTREQRFMVEVSCMGSGWVGFGWGWWKNLGRWGSGGGGMVDL